MRITPVGSQKGSALLFVLLAVVILGLAAGRVGASWQTIDRRAKERELLWRGDQYRKALTSYHKSAAAGQQQLFPQTLDVLLRDDRSLQTVRHLRRLYPDPVTGGDWVLIRDSRGGIRGVRSSSSLEPFQQDGFSAQNSSFAGKSSYAAWEFVHTPAAKKKSRPQPPVIPAASRFNHQ